MSFSVFRPISLCTPLKEPRVYTVIVCYSGYIGVVLLGPYRNNGKEHGNYYNGGVYCVCTTSGAFRD